MVKFDDMPSDLPSKAGPDRHRQLAIELWQNPSADWGWIILCFMASRGAACLRWSVR
jgi:hypothetical protein